MLEDYVDFIIFLLTFHISVVKNKYKESMPEDMAFLPSFMSLVIFPLWTKENWTEHFEHEKNMGE